MRVLDKIFGMRIGLHDGALLKVEGFDVDQFSMSPDRKLYSNGTHHAITFEATLYRKGERIVVWSRGETWDGIPGHKCIDGDAAQAGVLAHLALKPGDTDEDFFADYNEAQLDFCETYSDDLTMARIARFGDDS